MPHAGGQLRRELGVFHAVLLGLGSILGTGVFVSIGIAAGVAGPAVLVAIVLAGLLALCNGLSSAQLAAAHPVAGGTYEYGYQYLTDKLGFTAGWMFLLAKSASAATAALAASVLILRATNSPYIHSWFLPALGALALVVGLAGLVLIGIRRSAIVNAAIVLVTVSGLLLFIGGCIHSMYDGRPVGYDRLRVLLPTTERSYLLGLITATPLMFVAFTGYGRIATLGEEVHHPKRTIPIAIIVTLAISVVLYLGAGVFVTYIETLTTHMLNSSDLFRRPVGRETADYMHSLDKAGQTLWFPTWLIYAIGLAGITAMLGVLLNLILGLSRVALAMGRRGDLPRVFARVNASGTTPVPAVLLVAGIIAALTLVGDVKATWSFSAFTVLIYYGITNLACLRLPKEDRLYPRAFAWAGLGGCFFLAWWVEPRYWVAGCVLIVVGLFWQAFAQAKFKKPPDPRDVCAGCGYDLRASEGACPECGAAIPDDESDAEQAYQDSR